MKKIAVVTGANRGLGFETVRQLARADYQLILTARSLEKSHDAQARLKKQGLEVDAHALDVSDERSVLALRDWITEKYGRLDVLVNNAGVFLDSEPGKFGASSAMDAQLETLRKTMDTNVYGPFLLCQALIPLMLKNHFGRVVNVSSGMGQLSEMNGGYPAYRISKTALNAVTRIFADETQGSGVLVNSICPGWVKTDMGGAGAELSVEEGADTIFWAATLPDGGPSGGFFRNREPIAW